MVAAYGLILPQWVLDLPRLGCLNIHASLLRWRGAAPIQRAIEAGDAQTGVTIMQMDAGLDTGDMLLERVVPIGAETNAAQLHDALAEAGGEAIGQRCGRWPPTACRPAAARGRRDLRRQAGQGRGRAGLRAAGEPAGPPRAGIQPVPGANIRLPGLDEPVKIWRAGRSAPAGAVPGSARAPQPTASTSPPALARCACWSCSRRRQAPAGGCVRAGWQPA